MPAEINFYRNKGDNGYLSNFYAAPIMIGMAIYPTNEHYYQSRKATIDRHRDWIANAPTPYLAAVAGRALRPDRGEIDVKVWEERKVTAMLEAVRAKFTQNKDLKERLLETGDAILHEDSPTDAFWGKKGEDMLGKLLMKVREELRGK